MTDLEEYADLETKIIKHFTTIGVPQPALRRWLNLGQSEQYPRTLGTLRKIWKRRPSKQQYEQWCAAPKGKLSALQSRATDRGLGVRYPLLCGWSQDQVIEALDPFIRDLVAKFRTVRCEQEDCYQNGVIGVLHALRTDAGMSAFASHAYPRIKTMIRRSSASSGVVREPEKKPSRTEVRREITAWLRGNYTNHLRQLITEDSRLPKAKQQKVEEQAKRRFQLLEKHAPINKRQIVKLDDLREYKIQKIGQGNEVTQLFVDGSFSLTRLDLSDLLNLFDFLDYRFGCSLPSSQNSYFSDLNSEKYRTINDLVNRIAFSPDFHSNPMPLTGTTDDGFSLSEVLPDEQMRTPEQIEESRHLEERPKLLVAKMREILDLSPAQHLVMKYTYGLDGVEPMTGTEIASRFGELMGEKPTEIDKDGKLIYRQVSRQRITQYQKSIEKKVIVAVYDVMFPPQDKAALEMAIDKANLSPKQRLLACQHHGLKGAPELDIPTIALRYEDIIGDRLPVGELPAALIKAARERLVQDELLVIKQKLVGASL